MVRPCVARGFRRFGGFAVLHQCIRPLIGARLCSRPSWILARVRTHYRTGLERAIWVTSVRTRREDRSSISSHPLADLGGLEASGYIIASSSRPRRSNRLAIGLVGHPRLETPATGKNAPGDAGQLVGKRDREDVVVQPL